MKTILYVHSSSDLYGSDRCLLDLVTRLDGARYRPVVVLPYRGLLSEEMDRAGVRVVHQDPWVVRKTVIRSGFGRYLLGLPSGVRGLLRVLDEERVSLVHSNSGVVVGGALAAVLRRLPHVWHLREFFSEYPVLWPIHASLMGVLSKRLVCISAAVASQFPAGLRGRIRVIHDGIDPGRFGGPIDSGPARGALGLRNGGPVVGILGRVSEIKAQEIFIRSIPDVLSVHPQTTFLIVGDVFPGHEEYSRRLRALVETLGIGPHVVFAGFTRDVPGVLGLLDIVVLSTRIPEGLGISLLEGMAAGKPVIATAGGGTEEVVEDGVTGLLVPRGDFRALARAVVRLLGSPEFRRRAGEEGRRRVRERFSIDRTVATVQAVYDECLGGIA